MTTYGPNGPVEPPRATNTPGPPPSSEPAGPDQDTVRVVSTPSRPMPNQPAMTQPVPAQAAPAQATPAQPAQSPESTYQPPAPQPPGYQSTGYQSAAYQSAAYQPAAYPVSASPQASYQQASYHQASYHQASYQQAGYQPAGYPTTAQPPYDFRPPAAPAKRSRAVLVLSILLAVVVIAGVVTGVVLVTRNGALASAPKPPSTNACVNSEAGPPIKVVSADCSSATYQVIKVVSGTNDTASCDGVAGLTNYYTFTWPPDESQNYVLCLKKLR
jgi:hypothetical protein